MCGILLYILGMESCLWVDKHRPLLMDDIVIPPNVRAQLSEYSRPGAQIPPILFYGSPGTGKTSTILSFVQNHPEYSGSMLFINGSDERDISTVRTTISTFATSPSLFCGTPRPGHRRFIVIDEVDYMDMEAQRALKALVQSAPAFSQFCFICNYIHKVDRSLFLLCHSFSFANLPAPEIHRRLLAVCVAEGRPKLKTQIPRVRELYGSDMRSMIYYLQYYTSVSGVPRDSWKCIHDKTLNADDPVAFLRVYIHSHALDEYEFFMDYGLFLVSKLSHTQLSQWRTLFTSVHSYSSALFIQLATHILFPHLCEQNNTSST